MNDAVGRGRVDVRLWGKERGLPHPYPLICHLLDVAAVFEALWDALLHPQLQERIAAELGLGLHEARAELACWAGLHDLGKITPPFQAQVPEAFGKLAGDERYVAAPGAEKLTRFRHEQGTHWALVSLLAEAGYPVSRIQARSLPHQVAQLLGGHHGCFADVVPARQAASAAQYQVGLGQRGWDEQRRCHLEAVRQVVGAEAVPTGELSTVTAVRVYGLIVLADWLASSVEWILPGLPDRTWPGLPEQLAAHFRQAVQDAPGVVRAARLGRAVFPVGQDLQFDDLFPFPPNALQRDIAEVLPQTVGKQGSGLVLVTAPTGDGKTEAALFAAAVLGRASGARGLYFALPTMATADQMFPRVASFAERVMTGERALLLMHNAAWLSPAMDGAQDGRSSDAWTLDRPVDPGKPAKDAEGEEFSTAPATAVEAQAWLRGGGKRVYAAPLGAGTIDQALTAVLPVSFNALRLWGLSDKVLIVDEAHAYGSWMQTLMVRLLEWLGAFRAPVVLLSATLTGRTASSLVEAYRRGAGFTEPRPVQPAYPGWLFTDAATGEVSIPRAVATLRPKTLDVSLRQVAWDCAETEAQPRPGGRRSALREVLAPVAEFGGTALVCCTTVAEAQRTFRDLRTAFPALAGREGGIRLLHSRFPGLLRQDITAACERCYGKPRRDGPPGVRPASILVATQIVEQSLDFDFDLVVSDLAPLALLLQRAGRGRRHARGPGGRPPWALPEERPALVVLEPVGPDGTTEPPRSWGDVYDHSLLLRSAALLRQRAGQGVAVPDDVQDLVDAVYAEDFTNRLKEAGQGEAEATVARLHTLDQRRTGTRIAEETLAAMTGISAPYAVRGDLSRLSTGTAEVTGDLLTTRLGADTGRVLLLFTRDGADVSLDEDGKLPLPGGGSPDRATVRRIVARTVPVPGDWLPPVSDRPELPSAWRKNLHLRDLVLVPLVRVRDDSEGTVWHGQLDGRQVQFTRVTGLERT
ncbi:CRISPR-associated helicase Cas3' [Streptomyces sp. NBRC 14336]|uniref:CRISPR-associated helicase Cas3' n=1 Tax=Streptomyces sp. NBRC 14336 TaxID=3030992 RepID=UPI00255297CD|nr:CRISPR-associated helicase Cas3' [Streptomyces sp. NBRC 14336]